MEEAGDHGVEQFQAPVRLLSRGDGDLSGGALVDDIVYTLALTAIQSRGG